MKWVATAHIFQDPLDEGFRVKAAWPVSAHGAGGPCVGSPDASQYLDRYPMEFTFTCGTKARVTGRDIPGCHPDFATFVPGTTGAAKFSGDLHAQGRYPAPVPGKWLEV